MISSTLIRRLAAPAAFVAALSLAGATVAATPPASSHASSVAVGAVGAVGTGAAVDSSVVTAAAQSDTVGGAHQNHGGYVSCVARGGSDCTSTAPTLPLHPTRDNHPTGDNHPGAPSK